MNAISNFKGIKKELEGSKLYASLFPCNECAKSIIQSGIKEVVYAEEYHREDMWKMSKILLDKCGIKYRLYVEE